MIVPRIVFADTSFYTALMNRRDQHHERAIAWQRAIIDAASRIVTTEAVLWEFLNTF